MAEIYQRQVGNQSPATHHSGGSITMTMSHASCKAPAADFDWEHLGFDSISVNGHIQSTWSARTQKWSALELVGDPHVRLHGLSPGLNYGQQIFEGLKAFRSPNNETYIFRPRAHAARFTQSAAVVAIPPVPEELFLQAVSLAVRHNSEFVPPSHLANASLYIRPIAFAASPVLNLTRATEFTFCVFVMPVAAAQKPRLDGANVLVVEDMDRASPKGTGHVKVGGNYAPMTAVIEKAHREGFDLTLHLDCTTHTLIDEFAASSFLGIRQTSGSVTLVVPTSPTILKSITVDSLCRIAESWGWEIERRPVPFDQLPLLDEVFAVGTAFILTPVKRITRKSTATEIEYQVDYQDGNSAYRRLLEALRGIQSGRDEDQWQWMQRV
ncbi:hypothetical protein BST61_g4384 [Cercospora zeina]